MSALGGSGYEEFVDSELPRLLTLARLLAGNDHDAWDLTQECLVRVGLKWSSVDPKGNPHGYARRCLIRLDSNRLRKLRREWLSRSSLELPAGDFAEATTAQTALIQGLQRLTSRQRAVVLLHYVEDLPLPDVARLLGCSVGSAKSHLHRALEKLRRDLAEPSQAADCAVEQ